MKMKFKKSYSYKSHYQSPYGLYKFNIQYSFIKQFTDSTKSVLDIGGGDGRFSIPLMDDVNMLTVIDLSKKDFSSFGGCLGFSVTTLLRSHLLKSFH